MNESYEVWTGVHGTYAISQIIWKLHSIETNNWYYLAFTDDVWLNWQKKWMQVMNYEGMCMKNMEWVE